MSFFNRRRVVIRSTRSEDITAMRGADGATMLAIEERHLQRLKNDGAHPDRIKLQQEIVDRWRKSEKERKLREKARRKHERSQARANARRAKIREFVQNIQRIFGKGSRTQPANPPVLENGPSAPPNPPRRRRFNINIHYRTHRPWDEELSRLFAFPMAEAKRILQELRRGSTEGSTVDGSGDEELVSYALRYDFYRYRSLMKAGQVLGEPLNFAAFRQATLSFRRSGRAANLTPHMIPTANWQFPSQSDESEFEYPVPPHEASGFGPKVSPDDSTLPDAATLSGSKTKCRTSNGTTNTRSQEVSDGNPIDTLPAYNPQKIPIPPHLRPGWTMERTPGTPPLPDPAIVGSPSSNPPNETNLREPGIRSSQNFPGKPRDCKPDTGQFVKSDPQSPDTSDPPDNDIKSPVSYKNKAAYELTETDEQKWFVPDSIRGSVKHQIPISKIEKAKETKSENSQVRGAGPHEPPKFEHPIANNQTQPVRHRQPMGKKLEQDFFKGRTEALNKRVSAESLTLGNIETEQLYQQCYSVLDTSNSNGKSMGQHTEDTKGGHTPKSEESIEAIWEQGRRQRALHGTDKIGVTPQKPNNVKDHPKLPGFASPEEEEEFTGQAEFTELDLTISNEETGLTLTGMLAAEASQAREISQAARIINIIKKPCPEIYSYFHLGGRSKKLTSKGRSRRGAQKDADDESFDAEYFAYKRSHDVHRDSGITFHQFMGTINHEAANEAVRMAKEKNMHPLETFETIKGSMRIRPKKPRRLDPIEDMNGYFHAVEDGFARLNPWDAKYRGGVNQSERFEQMNLEKRLAQRDLEAKGLVDPMAPAPPRKIIWAEPKMPKPHLEVASKDQNPFDPSEGSFGIKLPSISSFGNSFAGHPPQPDVPIRGELQSFDSQAQWDMGGSLPDQGVDNNADDHLLINPVERVEGSFAYTGIAIDSGPENDGSSDSLGTVRRRQSFGGEAHQSEPSQPSLEQSQRFDTLLYDMPLTCDIKKMVKPSDLGKEGTKNKVSKNPLDSVEGIRDGVLLNAVIKVKNIRASEGDDCSKLNDIRDHVYITKFNYDVLIEVIRLMEETAGPALADKVVRGAAKLLDVQLPEKEDGPDGKPINIKTWMVMDYYDIWLRRGGNQVHKDVLLNRQMRMERGSTEVGNQKAKISTKMKERSESGFAEEEDLQTRNLPKTVASPPQTFSSRRVSPVDDLDLSRPGSGFAKLNPSSLSGNRPARDSPQSESSVKARRRRSSLGSIPSSPTFQATDSAYIHSIPEDFIRQYAKIANARILESKVQEAPAGIERRPRVRQRSPNVEDAS